MENTHKKKKKEKEKKTYTASPKEDLSSNMPAA